MPVEEQNRFIAEEQELFRRLLGAKQCSESSGEVAAVSSSGPDTVHAASVASGTEVRQQKRAFAKVAPDIEEKLRTVVDIASRKRRADTVVCCLPHIDMEAPCEHNHRMLVPKQSALILEEAGLVETTFPEHGPLCIFTSNVDPALQVRALHCVLPLNLQAILEKKYETQLFGSDDPHEEAHVAVDSFDESDLNRTAAMHEDSLAFETCQEHDSDFEFMGLD